MRSPAAPDPRLIYVDTAGEVDATTAALLRAARGHPALASLLAPTAAGGRL
jgi:hypothetical protein